MSKNNHTNYSKYSNKTAVEITPVVFDQLSVETTPAVVVADQTEVETITTVAVANQTEVEPPAEPIDGFVSGCKKLNVRIEPSTTGDIVCVVDEGVTLMIDESASTNEWYRVYTEAGAEGYCMKQFVTIKQ